MGWSYSYFAFFVTACLSICARSGEACEQVNGGSCIARMELAGLFASSLQKEANDASTIDSRGTALVTQAQYHESSPRSMKMARNRRLTMNLDKPRSEIALVLSHKRVP